MRLIAPILLATLAIAMTSGRAHSQANVNESEESNIYVDAQLGSDAALGTINSPTKTIQAAINKAIANNRKGIPTKVNINPGVYRETVNFTKASGQTSATITVQAVSPSLAIIAGSDVLSGWSQDSSTLYSRSWPYSLTGCATPAGWPTNFAPVALRTEMIFVNSVPLTQVMSYSDLRPGTFYIDDSSYMVYVSPAVGTNMGTAFVEAAARRQTLNLEGQSNVVLRGLVFEHAASCMNESGANITGSSNVLIDQVQAMWNNWGGLTVNTSTNVTVQNSTASHNGAVGFQGYEDQNALYGGNESDYNNWRGAQSAFYDWAMGGTKLMLMRNTTVQDHHSYRNQAQGLWFDTDNEDITIDYTTLAGNVMAGLQVEANEGPVTLESSTLCSNGLGINLLESENVTVEYNVLYDNGGTNTDQGEVFIGGQAGGRTIRDWQNGTYYNLRTTNTAVIGNTVADAASGQYVFGTYLSGSDWSDFIDTLYSSSNRWYDPITQSTFKIVNGKVVSLAGWQSATGQDSASAWAAATSSQLAWCAIPAPTFTDFSVNLDNRAYAMSSGKAVATVRVNSFGSGTVNLSVSGLPSGVSASLSNSSLVSGVVTLTLTASQNAVYDDVPVTLWASSDNRVHSVTFYVQVAP
ncbi:MAG: right-handed parallel beta-helix repeat-containing protein [Terracidiphilus sp.]